VTQDSGAGSAPGAGRQAGRRAGRSGTREAILDAARQQFADHGYERTTIRSIAAAAGVDPALVHHFYGTKERLFAAAMQLPVLPSEVLTAALAPGARDPGVGLGVHLVRTALRVWDDSEVRATFLGLLRSAMTSEKAAAMLREFIADTISRPIVQAVGAGAGATDFRAGVGAASSRTEPGAAGESGPASAGPGGRAELRAGLIATQMLGLAMCRYVLALPPVASASPDELAAAIGPVLERYLTGDLGQDAAMPT
jgi:AcrR family transcriptional regulator